MGPPWVALAAAGSMGQHGLSGKNTASVSSVLRSRRWRHAHFKKLPDRKKWSSGCSARTPQPQRGDHRAGEARHRPEIGSRTWTAEEERGLTRAPAASLPRPGWCRLFPPRPRLSSAPTTRLPPLPPGRSVPAPPSPPTSAPWPDVTGASANELRRDSAAT